MLTTMVTAVLTLSEKAELSSAKPEQPPKLAIDFYTGAFRSDSKTAGLSYDVTDGVCCPLGSLPEGKMCSAQTQQHGTDTYEQGSKERTRTDSAGGSIVSWFGNVMKQMVIVPSNGTTHKYDCAGMCPLNGTYYPTVSIGGHHDPYGDPYSYTKPRHLLRPGVFRHPTIVGGESKSLDRWGWIQKVAVIPMALITAYVDHTTTPAQLFGLSKKTLPFKGWENVSFVGFQPESRLNHSLDEYFDIDPATIASCPRVTSGCFTPKQPSFFGATPLTPSSGDADDPEVHISTLLARDASAFAKPANPAASKPWTAEASSLKPDPPLPNITFTPDWTATVDDLTVAEQNNYAASNGDLCCSYGAADAPPICAVSAAKTGGVKYFDVTNQRYRYDSIGNAPGAGVVVDYKTHKHMEVGYLNGTTVTVCKQYCPVSPRDSLKPHFFGFHNKVLDKGPTTWHGIRAQHYHWIEYADPLPIPLYTYDLYVDISDPHNAVPLEQTKQVTPFGMKSPGYFNTTWVNFKAGAPEPAKFAISGVDTCPKSSSCGTPPKQDERLQLGMFHTYMGFAAGDDMW